MDDHTSHEQAYKNGHDKGYADGKREAVKHGRWEHRPDKRICSFCNYRYSYFGGKDYNYCPNCGARMIDGGNEDG